MRLLVLSFLLSLSANTHALTFGSDHKYIPRDERQTSRIKELSTRHRSRILQHLCYQRLGRGWEFRTVVYAQVNVSQNKIPDYREISDVVCAKRRPPWSAFDSRDNSLKRVNTKADLPKIQSKDNAKASRR